MSFVAGEDGIVTNQMVIPGNVYFDEALHEADKHAESDFERARAILEEEGVDPSEARGAGRVLAGALRPGRRPDDPRPRLRDRAHGAR